MDDSEGIDVEKLQERVVVEGCGCEGEQEEREAEDAENRAAGRDA